MGLGLLGFKVFLHLHIFLSLNFQLSTSTSIICFDMAFAHLSLSCYASIFIISFGLLFFLTTKTFRKTKGQTFFQACGWFNIIHLKGQMTFPLTL